MAGTTCTCRQEEQRKRHTRLLCEKRLSMLSSLRSPRRGDHHRGLTKSNTIDSTETMTLRNKIEELVQAGHLKEFMKRGPTEKITITS
ncbi:hypothetical protein CR513_12953, partial [Mucuna pruriens]